MAGVSVKSRQGRKREGVCMEWQREYDGLIFVRFMFWLILVVLIAIWG